MKKSIKKLSLVAGIIFILAVLLIPALAGCSNTASTSPTTQTPSPADTKVVLSVTSGTQTKTYTLTQLKALPSITGYASQISKTNNVTGPYQYKGIAISELVKEVGGITEKNSIKVTASDNYSKTFTFAQVITGSITVMDSAGKELTPTTKPIAFLAYEKDGVPLDNATGPLQFGIMTSKEQVTQSSSWIKLTVKIEVVAAP